MTTETKRTFCRFCHASCAMLVDIEDNKVRAVRGDPESLLFGGYTCVKGRQMPDMHNLPERLIKPLIRRGGKFEEISTAEALAEAGARMKKIVEKHGPHSIAVYCGTNAFQNSAVLGTAFAFAQGIGTRNYYTSVTVDQPAKVYTTARYGVWMGGVNNFEESDVVMFVGNNPLVSHYSPGGGLPPFSPSRRLRDAKKRGLKVIVADPRESDIAKLADIYLPVKPGEDPALLAGMLHVIFAESLYDRNFVSAYVDGVAALQEAVSGFTSEVAAQRCGVEAAQIIKAARLFAKGKKGRIVTGTGPEMAGNGTLTEYLVAALNILCARFNQEDDKVANPALFMPEAGPKKAQLAPRTAMFGEGFAKSRIRNIGTLGREMPCNVLADEILTPGDGQIKAFISIGGNPEIAFPNQQKVRKALDAVDLFIQIDPWMSASAKRADLILAPSMCLEREDINNVSEAFCEEPYAHYTEAMVSAPGDTMDEYAMLWWLAKHMDVQLRFPGDSGSSSLDSGSPGDTSMEECPAKSTVLDLICKGSLLKPSKAKIDAQASQHPGSAMIYRDLHPVIGPPDPDAAEKFDLAVGNMPEQLKDYGANQPEEQGFDFRLISRRSKHRYNSNGHFFPHLRKKMPTNPAFVHPADLAALSLSDGDMVEITSPLTSIFAFAKSSNEVRRGVVSMSHAFGDDDAGKKDVLEKGNSTNRLMSDEEGLDPITGQALQSAIPVRLSAA